MFLLPTQAQGPEANPFVPEATPVYHVAGPGTGPAGR